MIRGWDDAPFEDVPTGGVKSVTVIYPFYCNRRFFRDQLRHWLELPARFNFIVVDDGSPEGESAERVLRTVELDPINVRLFKIEVDVRWNWLAARNIGMHHAPDGFCLGTDMDHLIPVTTAVNLVTGAHDPEKIYRFSRREHTGALIHSHPNSWFMTRAMFWKFGGYDEALSGHYGTDGDARRRWAKTAPVRTLKDELVRFERMGDSSTTRYGRKEEIDRAVPDLVALRGKGWKPKVLSFPYHEVQL